MVIPIRLLIVYRPVFTSIIAMFRIIMGLVLLVLILVGAIIIMVGVGTTAIILGDIATILDGTAVIQAGTGVITEVTGIVGTGITILTNMDITTLAVAKDCVIHCFFMRTRKREPGESRVFCVL